MIPSFLVALQNIGFYSMTKLSCYFALLCFRDVLNTPFYTTRKEGNPNVKFAGGYSPIPHHDKDGGSTTYKWPLAGSQGYYSEMYSGST